MRRGCDPKEIYSILKTNGFSEAEIKHAMFSSHSTSDNSKPKYIEFVNSKGEAIPFDGIQPDVDYERMAEPSLLSRPDLKVIDSKVIVAKKVQLYVIDHFLSAEECEEIVTVMDRNFRPSTITRSNNDGYRTSTTCDLGFIDDAIVRRADEKIAQALGIRLEWSDNIEGQRYEVGQEFKPHTDYYAPCSMEFKNFAGDLGQRTWTFMIYLNEPVQGGATYFTKLDETIYPSLGQSVIWNNLNRDGSPNPDTEHQGLPVEDGTKIIITKWFRDKGAGEAFYS